MSLWQEILESLNALFELGQTIVVEKHARRGIDIREGTKEIHVSISDTEATRLPDFLVLPCSVRTPGATWYIYEADGFSQLIRSDGIHHAQHRLA